MEDIALKPSQSQKASFRLIELDAPKVFISYRWGKHDAWVSLLAADLSKRGVKVIHDKTLRQSYSELDTAAFLVHLMKEMQSCHVFIPIFTPGYLMHIGYGKGKHMTDEPFNDGFVFDEFQLSLMLGGRREIETVAVLREGSFKHLPESFTEDNTLDMRSRNPYQSTLIRIARLFGLRDFDSRGDYETNLTILCRHLFLYRAIAQKVPNPIVGQLE